MASKGKAKNKRQDREQSKGRGDDDNISRITRTMRDKEHMAHEGQLYAGDEDLCRHLREPFKSIVLGRSNANG